MVSSNSPKKRTNEFGFTTETNSIVCLWGEFKDTKKSFRNYLTFKAETVISLNKKELKFNDYQ